MLGKEISAASVPVLAADVKGDLSGVAATGEAGSRLAARSASLGRQFVSRAFPVQFWDLFGHDGLPIRTAVHAMGPDLLGRMLRLNETQQGARRPQPAGSPTRCARFGADRRPRLDLPDVACWVMPASIGTSK
ncbi:helicase HerA-like domain-containing protein [Metarhizobium album]|uniref:helicase HerA-like domain-containing protein n=1 Tax=Metarhizobium album TaxID=2182425 RepID=UPI003B21BEED